MKSSLLMAVSMVGFCPSLAAAKDAGAEAAPMQFISSFNQGDVVAAKAAMSETVVITDEVAPYHWEGKNAFGGWLSALTADGKARQLSDERVVLGQATREMIAPEHGYLVFPATYSFKQRGVAMSEVAQMTFALDRTPAGWKIAAWTWTGPDPSKAK